MSLAGAFVSLAETLLGQYGAVLTLRRKAASIYDSGSDTVEIVQTVVAGRGMIDVWTPREIAGGKADAADVKVLLSAYGIGEAPVAGDEIEIAGRRLQVVGTPDAVYAEATPVLFIVRCRG